jgi:hypothetical protein
MFVMYNTEGNQYLLLEGIVDHQRDSSAIDRADMYVQRGSNHHLRKTTKGGNSVWNGRMAIPCGSYLPA